MRFIDVNGKSKIGLKGVEVHFRFNGVYLLVIFMTNHQIPLYPVRPDRKTDEKTDMGFNCRSEIEAKGIQVAIIQTLEIATGYRLEHCSYKRLDGNPNYRFVKPTPAQKEKTDVQAR